MWVYMCEMCICEVYKWEVCICEVYKWEVCICEVYMCGCTSGRCTCGTCTCVGGVPGSAVDYTQLHTMGVGERWWSSVLKTVVTPPPQYGAWPGVHCT